MSCNHYLVSSNLVHPIKNAEIKHEREKRRFWTYLIVLHFYVELRMLTQNNWWQSWEVVETSLGAALNLPSIERFWNTIKSTKSALRETKLHNQLTFALKFQHSAISKIEPKIGSQMFLWPGFLSRLSQRVMVNRSNARAFLLVVIKLGFISKVLMRVFPWHSTKPSGIFYYFKFIL